MMFFQPPADLLWYYWLQTISLNSLDHVAAFGPPAQHPQTTLGTLSTIIICLVSIRLSCPYSWVRSVPLFSSIHSFIHPRPHYRAEHAHPQHDTGFLCDCFLESVPLDRFSCLIMSSMKGLRARQSTVNGGIESHQRSIFRSRGMWTITFTMSALLVITYDCLRVWSCHMRCVSAVSKVIAWWVNTYYLLYARKLRVLYTKLLRIG